MRNDQPAISLAVQIEAENFGEIFYCYPEPLFLLCLETHFVVVSVENGLWNK